MNELGPYLYEPEKQEVSLPKVRRANFAKDAEQLFGSVKGMPARADEERLANELNVHPGVLGYQFRRALIAPRGMPGWKELDFLIQTLFGYVAVEVDDMKFVHLGKGSEMTFEDAQRIQGLAEISVSVHEIKHVDAARLADKTGAIQVVRELVG